MDKDIHAIESSVFPVDFLEAVADGAEQALNDYLRENAPHLADLLGGYAVLNQYIANARGGTVTHFENDHVWENVSQITLALSRMRRSFYSQGDGGEYIPFLDWLDDRTQAPKTAKRRGKAIRK